MQFPRHVFKNGGNHQRAGGSFSTELAQDEVEHDALLADGWFATLPEAIAPAPPEESAMAPASTAAASPDGAPEPTRDEIVQKLDELKVVFDRRLGTPKLRKLVDDAMKASAKAQG